MGDIKALVRDGSCGFGGRQELSTAKRALRDA
jgi:hypothetical protein